MVLSLASWFYSQEKAQKEALKKLTWLVGDWEGTGKWGQTRFKTYINANGQWVETGEFSRDGEKWIKFMIMTFR